MQARSEETRRRITQVALRLFSDRGYDSAGVAEICEAANVSKGAFYHHFPSKQALFVELLNEWLDGLDVDLGKALEGARNVPEGLLAMTREMRGVFSAADGRVGLFLEFWQRARRDPDAWQAFVAPYRRYQGFFAKIIEKGIEEGSLKPTDPQVAGQALVALAVGIVVQGVLEPRNSEWERVAHDAVALLISGLMSGAPVAESDGR
jgi:AcrR family transcriptional regulator